MKPALDLLAVHTSDAAGSIAVGRGGRIAAAEFEAAGKHAPVLLAAILDLLDTTGARLEDLGAVAVTTGPGSFTGIRVGLATVQGLAAARQWPVLPCDSLRAAAAAWSGRIEGPLAILLDARRGEVYAGLFDVEGGGTEPLAEPFCAPPAAAAERLARLARAALQRFGASRPLAIAGSGAALLPVLDGIEVRQLGPPPVPVARALVDLARAGCLAPIEPQALEPTYLRKSDAEVRRDSLRGSGA